MKATRVLSSGISTLKFQRLLDHHEVNAKAKRHFHSRKGPHVNTDVEQEGASASVCVDRRLSSSPGWGQACWPSLPPGPVYPTGPFSQLLGGDNVFHIWNSYHLCLASFAILRVTRGTILKLICWVFCLSVRNRRKQAQFEYLSDTCRPSARARSRRICC